VIEIEYFIGDIVVAAGIEAYQRILLTMLYVVLIHPLTGKVLLQYSRVLVGYTPDWLVLGYVTAQCEHRELSAHQFDVTVGRCTISVDSGSSLLLVFIGTGPKDVVVRSIRTVFKSVVVVIGFAFSDMEDLLMVRLRFLLEGG